MFNIKIDILRIDVIEETSIWNGYGGSSRYTHPYIHPPHYILGTLAAQVTPAALLLKASSREVSTQKSAWGKAWNHAITRTPVRCLWSTEELPALQPHLTAQAQDPTLPYKVKTAMQKVSAAHSTTLLSTSATNSLWLLLFGIYLNCIQHEILLQGIDTTKLMLTFEKGTCTYVGRSHPNCREGSRWQHRLLNFSWTSELHIPAPSLAAGKEHVCSLSFRHGLYPLLWE